MYPKVNPLNNIAALYDLLGDYDKALKYLDTAATVPTEDPFQTGTQCSDPGKGAHSRWQTQARHRRDFKVD
ncbi:MAG: tetratricopeptide repeat protein [Bacteroidota bacterium]